MVRIRAIAAIAASLAGVVLVSGCVSGRAGAGADPLTDVQRATIRAAILDSSWSRVAAEYPEAIRPRVTMAPTVPDHGWARAVVRCLREAGIVASVEGGVPVYGSAGQSPLEVAVRFYACEAGNPFESEVASYLSARQSSALYEYYLRVVRPCLLAAGAPSPASPDRSAAASLAGLAGWNPYQVIWNSRMSNAATAYLERRCPPTPPWLDLEPRA